MPTAYSYVRFSTPDQLRGGSLTRQGDAAAAWCEQHGYDLDDSHADLGRSAFSGAHRKGALGRFLAGLERKVIKPGSALLIESLDRLSREDVLDAMQMLTGIIQAGVKVVTLADGTEYTRETLRTQSSLFYILVGKMQGANDFSRTNSRRVADGKGKARQKAIEAGQAVSAMCPSWLRVEIKDGVRRYVAIEDRKKLLNEIFVDLANDVSKSLVVRRLNEAGKANFDRAGQGLSAKPGSQRGWHVSYLGKLVKNRALIGEFQPTTKRIEAGKIVKAVGDPIPGHYPVVIDPALFEKVNAMVKPVGRRGVGFANLFQGVARCITCQSPMHYLNKGERRPEAQARRKETRVQQYLVCDSAHRRVTRNGARVCADAKAIPYHMAEKRLIALAGFLTRADEFAAGNDDAAQWSARQGELRVQVAAIEKQVERTIETMGDQLAPMIQKIINRKVAEADALNEEIRKLATAAQQARSANDDRDYLELQRLYDEAEAATDLEIRFKLRSRLHGILGRTVDSIQVHGTRQEIVVWMRRGLVFARLSPTDRLILAVNGGRAHIIGDDGTATRVPTPPGILRQHKAIRAKFPPNDLMDTFSEAE